MTDVQPLTAEEIREYIGHFGNAIGVDLRVLGGLVENRVNRTIAQQAETVREGEQ